MKLVQGANDPFTTVTETDADAHYPSTWLRLERGSSSTPMPGSLSVTVGGSASNPEDYVFNQGNVFPSIARIDNDLARGARQVTIKDDGREEPNETITFSVRLDGQTWTATLTIVDDDAGENPPVVGTPSATASGPPTSAGRPST